MENPQHSAPSETLAQVLIAIKDDSGRTEQQIADSIGVHVSTFNTWINEKAVPRQPSLLKLASRYPDYKRRLFAAVGKRVPAPLPPDRKEALFATFDRLTEEQQQMLLIQANALADSNEQGS